MNTEHQTQQSEQHQELDNRKQKPFNVPLRTVDDVLSYYMDRDKQ